MVFLWDFSFHPRTNDVEHSFFVFLCHLLSSSAKCLFQIFAFLKICCYFPIIDL